MTLPPATYRNCAARWLGQGLLVSVFLTTLTTEVVGASAPCVRLEKHGSIARDIPAGLGSKISLSFRHSIYGSQVEEIFLLRRDGLELHQLRYSEARLVDFYGHEAASHENGAWVVMPAPAFFSSLDLSLSGDASMTLLIERRPAPPVKLVLQRGSALRIAVASCNNNQDG